MCVCVRANAVFAVAPTRTDRRLIRGSSSSSTPQFAALIRRFSHIKVSACVCVWVFNGTPIDSWSAEVKWVQEGLTQRGKRGKLTLWRVGAECFIWKMCINSIEKDLKTLMRYNEFVQTKQLLEKLGNYFICLQLLAFIYQLSIISIHPPVELGFYQPGKFLHLFFSLSISL